MNVPFLSGRFILTQWVHTLAISLKRTHAYINIYSFSYPCTSTVLHKNGFLRSFSISLYLKRISCKTSARTKTSKQASKKKKKEEKRMRNYLKKEKKLLLSRKSYGKMWVKSVWRMGNPRTEWCFETATNGFANKTQIYIYIYDLYFTFSHSFYAHLNWSE